MIEEQLLRSIKTDTERFWNSEVSSQEFKSLATGKEIGHRIADYVDERTTAMLSQKYSASHQLNDSGVHAPRSMGDVWINSGGQYNPVNVKAGEAGKNARPNLVSLNRLLSALLSHQIDSYYLLIVKMRIPQLPASADFAERNLRENRIIPNVYFVDLLDERTFYEFCDSNSAPNSISLMNKVQVLVNMLEDGHGRLIANRKRTIESARQRFALYSAQAEHPIYQGGLNFG
jgi:hypothetical protein